MKLSSSFALTASLDKLSVIYKTRWDADANANANVVINTVFSIIFVNLIKDFTLRGGSL